MVLTGFISDAKLFFSLHLTPPILLDLILIIQHAHAPARSGRHCLILAVQIISLPSYIGCTAHDISSLLSRSFLLTREPQHIQRREYVVA